MICLFKKIVDNPTYIYISPDFFIKDINKNKILTLIDLKSFNKAKLDEINDELYIKYIINDYKIHMISFYLFDEIYILVDIIILKNIQLLINNDILGQYNIILYIIYDENFKKIYPTFFNIKRYNSVEDSPTYFIFEFKFGEFCNYFKISAKDYYEMYKIRHNYYPFPLIGNIEVKNGEELIDCKFSSQMMSSGMFILFYPKNDKYFLDYESQNFCVFKLIKNLTEQEAKRYKSFMEEYETLGYWFFAPPL